MKRTHLAAITLALFAGFAGDPRAVAGEPATTIAVLDFLNRRPGDGHDWLGKGLADMVITDLSASERLTVVDRERMQQLAREHDLVTSGIVDENTAPAVGRVAKVEWVLQGTFACQGTNVTIEALLVDVARQQVMRIDRIEGPLDDVFELEEQLIGRVLENLNAPMSAAELRRVKILKTRSLPAFEHYSRSLALFDNGQWYAALQEARLAQRADPEYLIAAGRVAQLYEEVGEREHALIEYQRLVGQDDQNALPEIVYFRMAVLLDEAMGDRDSAAGILQRLLERYRDDLPAFDVTVPSRLSGAWDDVGGIVEINRIARQSGTRLRTLARLAHWQEQAGNDFQAARLRSQMRYFMFTHGMPFGNESLHFWPSGLQAFHTGSEYWDMVRENRDRTLYPGTIIVISHGETVDAKTAPTHGYYKWKNARRFWLAPPDYEIAKVSYRVAVPVVDQSPNAGNRDTDLPVQFDFRSPESSHSQLFKHVKVKRDGKWQELNLDKGIRAINSYVHHDDRWQMRFELRPWTEPAELPRIGGFQVNLLPGGAELFRNGKSHGHVEQGRAFLRIPTGEYRVEARWPDGRHRSKVFRVEQGRRIQFCLNADVQTVSRTVVGRRGSYPCLLTDRADRFWLVWDEYQQGSIMTHNKESSIYSATSSDGFHWSRPRRLPVSSLSCDFAPILRQDRRGVYWLMWISERGSKARSQPSNSRMYSPSAVTAWSQSSNGSRYSPSAAPRTQTPVFSANGTGTVPATLDARPGSSRNLWIASSSNGVEWSFPRKVALPEEVLGKLDSWREGRVPYIAFTIDRRNVFWLIWHGWLLRSDDAESWQVDCELRTGAKIPDHGNAGKHYHLTSDDAGRLLLLTNRHGGDWGAELWRRSHRGDWESVDRLTDEHSRHMGSVACRQDGSILAVTPYRSDLHVHEFDHEGNGSEPVIVETYLSKPFHPAIAPLPDNRWLVAFGSTEGIVAAIFRKDG